MLDPERSAQLQACIVDCLECYSLCRQEAMSQSPEAGGRQAHPEHFRLMHDCAEICRTSADFMLSSSSFHRKVCALCSDICEACARSCEALGGMEVCARACRGCAQSCGQLAQR
jgi:hypothetical protein